MQSASVRLGLFHIVELVAVMTLSKCPSNVRRYEDPYTVYELTGFASVGVHGAFSKLLSYFWKMGIAKTVYSFADLDVVDRNSNVYSKNGFVVHHSQQPDYRYITENGREHKFGFRKEELLGNVPNKVFDSGKICYIISNTK